MMQSDSVAQPSAIREGSRSAQRGLPGLFSGKANGRRCSAAMRIIITGLQVENTCCRYYPVVCQSVFC